MNTHGVPPPAAPDASATGASTAAAALHLTITTPLAIVLDEVDVASLRAEDASGDFGIRPGHADFLTVIDAGVLRWRAADGPWRYCALRGGVLSVEGGRSVRVACREATVGNDLGALQARIAHERTEAREALLRARSQDTRLHARAIRQLMRELRAGGDTLGLSTEAEG